MTNLTYAQKTKLINRLAQAGFDTEKKYNDLELESILKIPNISISDIQNIVELKKVVKSGKLLSYLTGSLEAESEEK